jgi:hypothetical protein
MLRRYRQGMTRETAEATLPKRPAPRACLLIPYQSRMLLAYERPLCANSGRSGRTKRLPLHKRLRVKPTYSSSGHSNDRRQPNRHSPGIHHARRRRRELGVDRACFRVHRPSPWLAAVGTTADESFVLKLPLQPAVRVLERIHFSYRSLAGLLWSGWQR